jgi:hypothetical protein
MQPIGPDDKIKVTGRRLFEPDHDAILILLECGDRVIEEIADIRPSRLVEDGSKIAPENLIGRHDASSAEGLDRHFGAVPSGFVNPGDAPLGNRHGADLVEQTHALHHRTAGAAKINGLPARTRTRCTLDDRDGEAGLA